jgi:WD40 repeat protein
MTLSNPRPNPYVGPRAFETGETLYGRDHELQELLDLLIAERIVLLYSPSGAGKSSLIHAGLVPRLREVGFHVLPVVRVNQEPAQDLKSPTRAGDDEPVIKPPEQAPINRYLFSTLLSLEEGMPSEQQLEASQLSALSLTDYLDQRPISMQLDLESGEPPSQLLIFDQFEEVITLDPTDQEGKAVFFAQLGAALRDRNRWALISLREDYVAALDPYLRHIPTRLSNRFRLDLLGVSSARQAIQQPVKNSGIDFSQPAVNKLVNDLRQIQVQLPDGSMETRLGPYVEPVQLQVVCFHLWQQLSPEKMLITEDDLSSIGNVDQSLASYYASQASVSASRANVKERLIRNWFEHELITESGLRGQVLMGADSSKGLANTAIRMLVDAHLVRAEKRLGATWFELAHDRLIQPVRSDNATWFQENLSLLQRQASLWAQQNRSETLYLREEPLAEAEKWASEHPDELSQIDQDFLTACLEVRTREEAALAAAERERQLKLEAAEKVAEAERLRAEEQSRAASRLRRRAFILAGVLILAIFMAALAVINQQAAQRNAQRAEEQRTTAEAASNLAVANAATAQAASTLAYDNALIAEANAVEARAASTAAVAQQITAEYNAQVARTQEQLARQQANLARSRELASVALSSLKQDSELSLLLSKEALGISDTGQALDALLRGLQRNLSRKAEKSGQIIPRQEISVYSLASSPDGRRIAWGGTDGLFKVWDLEAQDYAWRNITTPGQIVTAMIYTPDGQTLITGDTTGTLDFWDIQSGRKVRSLPSNISQISDLAFSPDGTTLAYSGKAQGTEANIYTRNLETDVLQGFRIRQGEVAEASTIAWSPDGKLLASGGPDRIVHIWDAATGEEIETIKNIVMDNAFINIYEGPIRSLAFSPNGKWLVTGSEDNEGGIKDKTILMWDTSAWTQEAPVIFQGKNDDVTVLAFSPDGQSLVAGYDNGDTAIWNFNKQEINEIISGHTQSVTALDFSPFEEALLLATSSLDQSILLHNLIAPQSLNTPLVEDKGNPTRLAVDLDGMLLIGGDNAGELSLWEYNPASGGENQLDTGGAIPNIGFALSVYGSRLATIQEDGNIHISEKSGEEVLSIAIPQSTVEVIDVSGQSSSSEEVSIIDSLAFSVDEETLAGGACSQRRRVTDPLTNLVTESCLQNTLFLWNLTSGELLQQIPSNQTSAILSMAFNPQDANSLAVGYRNGAIQFWNLETAEPVGLPLIGLGGSVTSLSFHSDGDILASGGENNLIALWNLSPPQMIGDPIAGSDGGVTGLAFSTDNSALYSASNRGSVYRWNVMEWQNIACDLAQRNLTETEWQQFFPGQAYRPTCEQIPIETPAPTPTLAATPTPTP